MSVTTASFALPSRAKKQEIENVPISSLIDKAITIYDLKNFSLISKSAVA